MSRIVWLFSLVLGYSRHIFARFVMHQDLQTLLRCHMLAFSAIGGETLMISTTSSMTG
jgi:transposase